MTEVVRIDLMLAEFRAACYLAAMGRKPFAELDAMEKEILTAVEAAVAKHAPPLRKP